MGQCCSSTQDASNEGRQKQEKQIARVSYSQTTTLEGKKSSLYSISGSSVDIVQWKSVPEQDYDKLFILPDEQQIDINSFHWLKVLGRGQSGKVILVEHKATKQLFAMKIICKSESKKQYIKTEKYILQSFYHPFLVTLHYAFQTTSKVYLIMDFVIGGELFHHLRYNQSQFSEEKVRFYVTELVIALKTLHENQIIYRDLKPENILIQIDGHIKLTDFGMSKMMVEEDLTYSLCGTPEYVAPEIILQQGYDKSVDWYSLGVLMYEMLAGEPPFYSKNKQQMQQTRYRIHFPFRIVHKISKPVVMQSHFSMNAKALLTGLLDLDAKKRLKVEDIMIHPFFDGIDWSKVEERQLSVPFIPCVQNEFDLSNFDDTFTKMSCKDTPVSSNTAKQYSSFSFIESLKQQIK